jgi:hypothetical protein
MSETVRTPSETLMAALEEVENAQDCLIIIVGKDGDMLWHTSTDRDHAKLGMLEFVKQAIVARVFKED